MKVLILGADGMIGHKMAQSLNDKNSLEIILNSRSNSKILSQLYPKCKIYENDFLQNELGLMDENIWQAKRNAMEANYNFCEGRPVFEIRKNTLDSRLVELVESFPDECVNK